MKSKKVDIDIDVFDAEFLENHFRVAIFGSARIEENEKWYTEVFKLAQELGKRNFDIVTGGGPGLMEAANSGHILGRENNGSHSIGLTIALPTGEVANEHLDIRRDFDTFSRRLDTFMILSQAVIVMPGGVGTLLEFFYTWQLTQVQHICRIPIILYGGMWEELVNFIKKGPLKNKFLRKEDMQNLYLVKKRAEILEIIEKTYETYQKEGNDFCLNYKKYKII